MKKILVIRLSSLGDILHTLPAFADLRGSFPDARIDWLAGRESVLLLSAVPGIDALHVLGGWKQSAGLIQNLRRNRYDCSVDFQGLLKTGALGALIGARTRAGFDRHLVREPPAHWFYNRRLAQLPGPLHIVEQNRRLAALSGAGRRFTRVDFRLPGSARRPVDELVRREGWEDFVVINPGGVWPTKRWAPERYGALASRIIAELRLPVAVTTGPGEDPLYEGIAASCGSRAWLGHLRVSFLELVPLLERARLCVGGDTGPFHLACAVGTPVVGIFGPTSPSRNGPWRDEDEAVWHRMDCSGCHKRRCSRKNECMDIAVEEVFSAVVRRLERAGGSPVANA